MEKLNQLVEALYPQYGAPGSHDVDITARRNVIDEAAAVIAEAFRALEQENILLKQGCENNPLVHELIDMQERAEAAEAKVKELEAAAFYITHIKKMAEAAPAFSQCDDYFASLVSKARTSADKAMLKFPQPNYVLLKVAEEAGEVVQAGVHYAENRMTWQDLEGEIVQLLAMLIRLVTEGDQVNGITPPEECRNLRPAPAVSLLELVPDGWKLVPVEPTAEMIDAVVDVVLSERREAMNGGRNQTIPRDYIIAALAAAPEP